VVQAIEFNKSYPASTFWPTLQPGVVVLDTISNTTYTVPGQPAPHAAPEQAPVAGQAVRATPPWSWEDAAAPTALGLGVAVLVAVLIVWWRKR
jgi:hypothetical protein